MCSQCGCCFEQEEAFMSHTVNEHTASSMPTIAQSRVATAAQSGDCSVGSDGPKSQTGSNSCGGVAEHHSYAMTSKHGGMRLPPSLKLADGAAAAKEEAVEKHVTTNQDMKDVQ
jgi:hypothetical protein